jgi:hypothetical protein
MWRKFLQLVSFSFVLSQVGSLYGAAPPRLAVSANAGQITLSWQDTNYWLQVSPTLAPAAWGKVPDLLMVAGTTNRLVVPASQGAAFYRLVYAPYFPPPAELSLTADEDALGNPSFLLSWDAVPNADSYDLYFATDPAVTQFNFLSLSNGAAITGITNLAEEVDGLLTGQHYYFVATAVQGTNQSADSAEATGLFSPQGSVSGEVDTMLQTGTNLVQLPLVGVSVTLSNLSDPTLNGQMMTSPDGVFEFNDQPAGSYTLNLSSHGFGGYSTMILLSNIPVDLGVILLAAATNAGLVYGQLTLQDGSVVDSSLNPTITLYDTNGAVLQVTAPDANGDYVMAGLPIAHNLALSAQAQQSSVSTNIDTSLVGGVDLVLPETPPVLDSLVATLNSQPVVRVPGGTTVQVAATVEPGSNPLQYYWFQADGTPLPGASGSNVNWTVPSDPEGYEYLYLNVTDNYGGFASGFVVLTVNSNLVFSGQVVGSDTNASPITNAVVQLNTLVTNTDANGYFSVLVMPTNEYDLTIGAPGYVPLGLVYFDEAPDQQYPLLQVLSSPCTNDASSEIQVVTPSGVSVDIPPGSLVDTNGHPYAGCVSVAMNLEDPCSVSLPMGAAYTSDGHPLNLATVADIDLEGTNGPLSLSDAATAQVFLPVSAACAANTNLLADEPIYAFNPAANAWVPVGSGSTAISGGFFGYQGAVLMLTALAVGDAPAKTSTLEMVPDGTMPLPIKVRILAGGKITYADITPSNKKVPNVAQGAVNILILNPRQAPGAYYGNSNTEVTDDKKDVIQQIDVTLGADPLTVNLGLGKTPAKDNQTRRATLQLKASPTPTEPNPKAKDFTESDVDTLVEKFLQRTTKNAIWFKYQPGSDADANKYYQKIGSPATFTDWQKADKFTPRPKRKDGTIVFKGGGDNAETLANARGDDLEYGLYFNSADLGAGRRVGMNIWKEGGQDSVAYYAATYATLDDAVNDQNVKYIACMDSKPGASRIDGAKNIIRFYVFDATGKQLTSLNNEKQGGKPVYVPNVCTVCHGGSDASFTTGPDAEGQFIAFDTANFTFANDGPFTYKALTGGAARAALPEGGAGGNKNVFCSLNDGLLTGQKKKATMPKVLSALITVLTKGNNSFYGGPAAARDGFPANWVDGTANDAALYTSVYAVSCRSCHSTHSARIGHNWEVAAAFSDDADRIARFDFLTSLMPQSQRTYTIYWGSHTGKFLDTQGIVNQGKIVDQPKTITDVPPPVK